MCLDLYLSEFAPSDAHGGGLTLLRVLGDVLDRIALFSHLAVYPPMEKYRSRCLEMPPMWLASRAANRWLGCRPSRWLRQQPVFNRINARKIAAQILARLPSRQRSLRALVCPQHTLSLYVTEVLRERYGLKYITWIMDDHYVRWHDGKLVYPPNIEALFARHLQHANVVFVISQVMADFYRSRFGVESRVLFGPADVAPAPSLLRPAGDHLRLGYFGAVTDWQMDALELVALNCASAGATLDIYSGLPELPENLRCPAVKLMARIPAAQVVDTMSHYQAVVLPISFRQEQRQFSELNIATKMSECLASGTVTLAVGPPYAAMIRLLTQHSAAACVTTLSSDALALALDGLRNTEQWSAWAVAARLLAIRQVSTKVMQDACLRGITELCNS